MEDVVGFENDYLYRLRTGMEGLIQDQMRMSHKTKNDEEENVVQIELI